MILIAICMFFFIILANFKMLGKIKSQSLDLVKTTELEYEMNINTFPIHYFTEMTKFEVTNRMECLINKAPVPCMKYCETITANNPTY